jgi:hypothetical protein
VVKILCGKASKAYLALGKKEKSPLAASLFFFLSHNKQKSEHQSESNSTISWNTSLWKSSLCHATLRKAAPLLPAGQLQTCLHESAEQTGEHYASPVTPISTSQEHNPAQPLSKLNTPNKTE